MTDSNFVEASDHADVTGHTVKWNFDCGLWVCLDCTWGPAFKEIPLDPAYVARLQQVYAGTAIYQRSVSDSHD